MPKTWMYLDADGAEVKHGKRYLYVMDEINAVGTVIWVAGKGYVLVPDKGAEFRVPFHFEKSGVVRAAHLRRYYDET